jgi:chlorophyll synthase
LVIWGKPWHALAVLALLLAQVAAMRVLFRDPKGKAPWYNGTGVVMYVSRHDDHRLCLRGLADDAGLAPDPAAWAWCSFAWARSWC